MFIPVHNTEYIDVVLYEVKLEIHLYIDDYHRFQLNEFEKQ